MGNEAELEVGMGGAELAMDVIAIKGGLAVQVLVARAALVEARKDMEKVVEKWIIRVGAAGKA